MNVTYPQPTDWHVEPDASGFRVVVKQKPATGKEA